MSRGGSRPARPPGEGAPARRPAPLANRVHGSGDADPAHVSALAVPLLLGCLVLCAIASYLLGPWGLIVLAAVIAGAMSFAIRRPGHRDAAVAAVLGGLIGSGGVLLLALLRLIA